MISLKHKWIRYVITALVFNKKKKTRSVYSPGLERSKGPINSNTYLSIQHSPLSAIMASANSIFISISSSMVERWQWIMFFPFFSDQRTKAPDNLTPISYRRSFWRSGPCYRPQLLKSVNSSSKRLEFGRKSSNSTWTTGKKKETLALNRLVFLFEFQPFQIWMFSFV